MMIGDFNSMGWWAPGFGLVFMLLWWGLIVLAIFALVRWLTASSGGGTNRIEKDALDILKERYASGEIDREEFEKIRREISQ